MFAAASVNPGVAANVVVGVTWRRPWKAVADV